MNSNGVRGSYVRKSRQHINGFVSVGMRPKLVFKTGIYEALFNLPSRNNLSLFRA